MFRQIIVSLMILSAIACCMGQTFQYSRGWTNGKRSNTNLHDDFSGIIEVDAEKKLEKCLINLQRMLHGTYGFYGINSANQLLSSSGNNKLPNNNNNNHHSHSNEIIDEFGTDSGNLVKRQTNLF